MNFFGPEILILTSIAAGVVFLVYWIKALIEIIQSTFQEKEDKYLFIFLIVLLPFIGTIAYYTLGRKRRLNYDSEREEFV